MINLSFLNDRAPYFILSHLRLFLMSTLLITGTAASQVDLPLENVRVEKRTDPMGREYYLYLPGTIDPDRIYWLVCHAHGYQRQGSDAVVELKHFVSHGDCISVSPTFPSEGYQFLGKGSGDQLIGIMKQLSQQYHLHSKLLVFGHSGGGQFAHRFALEHPELVVGCGSFSSGTWSTGGTYHSLNQAADSLPIAISCGELDTEKSVPESPMDRYTWFKKFSQLLQTRKFFFKTKSWPETNHSGNHKGQEDLAFEAFLLGACGMLPQEEAHYDDQIKAIEKNISLENFPEAAADLKKLQENVKSRSKKTLRASLLADDWHINEKALAKCVKAGVAFVEEETDRLQKKMNSSAIAKVETLLQQGTPSAIQELQKFQPLSTHWSQDIQYRISTALRMNHSGASITAAPSQN